MHHRAHCQMGFWPLAPSFSSGVGLAASCSILGFVVLQTFQCRVAVKPFSAQESLCALKTCCRRSLKSNLSAGSPTHLAACRYLGLTLAEWQQREEGGRLFGRRGRLYWLVSLQLCPAIWALIIGLVSLFLHKVPPTPQLLFVSLVIPSLHAPVMLSEQDGSSPALESSSPVSALHMGPYVSDLVLSAATFCSLCGMRDDMQ